MEVMRAPAPTRRPPFLQERHIPSMPIPIPARRTPTDPPPRSPERTHSNGDLLFDMSPLSPEDAPLSHFPSLCHVSGNLCHRRVNTLLPRPVEKAANFSENQRPHGHEPFMYSVPRIPLRLPALHSRSQSEVLAPLQSNSISPTRSMNIDGSRSSSHMPSPPASCSSISTSASAAHPCLHFVDTTAVCFDDKNMLTSAFQGSISSSGGLSSSFTASSVGHDVVPSRVPSSGSLRRQQGVIRSVRGSPVRHRRSLGGARYPTSILRTTTAAPVVSFAQAELDIPPSAGLLATEITRGTRPHLKSPPRSTRVTSNYPVVRRRRSSLRHERGLRLSDEELGGTSVYDEANFGLAKFLPTTSTRRPLKDEKDVTEFVLAEERGRTRNRAHHA